MPKKHSKKEDLAHVIMAIIHHHTEDLETALEDIFDADFVGRRLRGQVHQEVKAAYVAVVRASVNMIHQSYKEEIEEIAAQQDENEKRLVRLEKEVKKAKKEVDKKSI